MAGTLTIDTLKASSGVLATQNGMTGIAKAWVNFNGSGGAIRGSYNVSSITVFGTGDYTVNFTTAMPNANYCISCTGGAGGAGFVGFVRDTSATPVTTGVRVGAFNASWTPANPTYFSVAILSS